MDGRERGRTELTKVYPRITRIQGLNPERPAPAAKRPVRVSDEPRERKPIVRVACDSRGSLLIPRGYAAPPDVAGRPFR
jgi:hypothetical protein